MRLLQLCNVGTRVGGTGACVVATTTALPDWIHAVRVLGPIEPDFASAMPRVDVQRIDRLTAADCRGFDAVLLHNTAKANVEEPLVVRSIQYVHSDRNHAAADETYCCSKTLSHLRDRGEPVLWQGVPSVRSSSADTRGLGDRLRVGRLCTPTTAKWPTELAAFYRELATECPYVDFEFVGCPEPMRRTLKEACRRRAVFTPAGPEARRRLADWHVLLYANRRVPETFGRTVAEAMRAGCIPVVDDIGGFREQLDAGGGFLCRTLQNFIAALKALRDLGNWQSTSRQAVAVADNRFSHARYRERLLSILK